MLGSEGGTPNFGHIQGWVSRGLPLYEISYSRLEILSENSDLTYLEAGIMKFTISKEYSYTTNGIHCLLLIFAAEILKSFTNDFKSCTFF